MAIVLLTTTNFAQGPSKDLVRMLESVAAARDSLPDQPIHLFALFQGVDGAHPLPSAGERDIFLTSPGRLPLSEARNRLLLDARAKGLVQGDALIAFPDDDCWYPQGFLKGLVARFAAEPTLDFWFCRYSTSPDPLPPSGEPEARLIDIIRRASSNTIFMRASLVVQLPLFDPNLGVGTAIPGSEDTDYVLHAAMKSRRTRFLDRPCVGHRDFNPAIRAKYFPPGLIVLARHAVQAPAGHKANLALQALRKVAVGCVLMIKGELPVRDLLRALGAAWRLRASRAPDWPQA